MRPARTTYAPGTVGKAMRQAALDAAKHYQQLSCAEGGQFDRKFWTADQRAKAVRGERIR